MQLTSKHRASSYLPRQVARQRRDKEKKTQNRTLGFNGNGFLKYRFFPLLDTKHEELRNAGKVEREFFSSLSNLASLYGFQPLGVSDKAFPYNILLAYRHATIQVKTADPELHLIIIQDDKHAASLATAKPYDTGATLYYVPVSPLYELLKDKNKKRSGELLLSVYAYLYQIAGVPYYRDSRAYLYYTYEMMEEWVKDNPTDWEEEAYTEQVSCFNSLKYYGDIVMRKIRNPYNLQQFENRVKQYTPLSAEDDKLHDLCNKFLRLYQNFPCRSIIDNIQTGMMQPEKEERVYPDQYISFYWNYNDCLWHSLFETVNQDLQEKEVTEEPISIQLLDGSQGKELSDEMEFEKRFFNLLEELSALL